MPLRRSEHSRYHSSHWVKAASLKLCEAHTSVLRAALFCAWARSASCRSPTRGITSHEQQHRFPSPHSTLQHRVHRYSLEYLWAQTETRVCHYCVLSSFAAIEYCFSFKNFNKYCHPVTERFYHRTFLPLIASLGAHFVTF